MNWRTSSGTSAVKPLRLCLVIIINYVISSSCDDMKVISVDADDDAVENSPSNPAAALSQVGFGNERGRQASETGNGFRRRPMPQASMTFWRPTARRLKWSRSRNNDDNMKTNDYRTNHPDTNLFVDAILCRRPYSKFCVTGGEDVPRLDSRGAQRQQLLPISPAAEDSDEVFELLDPEAWQARQLSAFQQTKFSDGVAGRRRAGNGAEANRKRVGAPPKGFVLSRGRRRRRTAVSGL